MEATEEEKLKFSPCFRHPGILAVVLSGGAFAIGITCGLFIPVLYITTGNTHHKLRVIFYAAMFGSILTGILMNFIGRKLLLKGLIVSYGIGWLLYYGSNVRAIRFVGVVLVGISFGGFSVISPIYLSEIARTKDRGACILTFDVLLRFGFFIGFLLNVWHSHETYEVVPIVLYVSSVVLLVPCFFVPEPPLIWALKGNMNKAEETLNFLHAHDYDNDNELEDLRLQVSSLKFRSLYFKSALKRRGTLLALGYTIALEVIQQTTEICAYLFWSAEAIYTIESTVNAYWFTVTTQILVKIVGTFASLLTIDVIGRRMLLIISSIGVLICSLGLAIRNFYFMDEWVKHFWHFDIVLVTGLNIMNPLGLDSVPVVLVAECFTPDIKWFGATIMSLLIWVRRLLICEHLFSYDVLMVFRWHALAASFAAGAVLLFSVFLVIETKGRRLNEIHEILHGSKIVR